MTEDRSTPDDAPEGEPRFSFSDKRKVDPTDGSVRPSGAAGEQPSEPVDPIDAEAAALFGQAEAGADGHGDDERIRALEAQVAELTEQSKREQAEYVNSRRRIEQAAEAGKEQAAGRVLASLIGVLDDIALGREHGDIAEGTPFGSIAAKLEETLRTQGLERYGQVGDEFDPTLHEALMHEDVEGAESTTIKLVMQAGYTVGGRVLRPARVATQGPA
ncbi:nucleotide exchange factor GrpE [Brachybacterium squillarum]|uniref:nucleotide exchange factor GrpE n=1 Tax=Brachybacterium squillarum TaxID=661979 RepID=UPI00026294CA|nr:nucleotide exchange factor GrpE [Brachybacterium squillarum]